MNNTENNAGINDIVPIAEESATGDGIYTAPAQAAPVQPAQAQPASAQPASAQPAPEVSIITSLNDTQESDYSDESYDSSFDSDDNDPFIFSARIPGVNYEPQTLSFGGMNTGPTLQFGGAAVFRTYGSATQAAAVPKGMNMSAFKRLRSELLAIQTDPPPGCTAQLKGDDILDWEGSIRGPAGTPYEGGIFKLSIVFDDTYPFKPPKVRFLTRIYHCNVNGKGYICLDILKTNWSPALTISSLLLSLRSLLNDCNPNDPLEPSIAKLFLKNREQHDKMARDHTQRFAMPKNENKNKEDKKPEKTE